MNVRRQQKPDDQNSVTPNGGFDSGAYAALRRRRIDDCRDHRARYLAHRAAGARASSAGRPNLVSNSRRVAFSAAAAFVALVTLSAVSDSAYLIRDDSSWATLSYWLAGLSVMIGALAIAGSVTHWVAVPRGSTARRASVSLALGNLVVLALVGAGWLARDGNSAQPGALALVLGITAAGVAIVSGGLSGELLGGREHATSALSSTHGRQRLRSVAAEDAPERVAAQA